MQQRFVIVGGEPEPAILPVFEALQQTVGQLDGKVQVLGGPAGLQQFDDGVHEKRVVIEVGIQARTTIFAGGKEAAVDQQ